MELAHLKITLKSEKSRATYIKRKFILENKVAKVGVLHTLRREGKPVDGDASRAFLLSDPCPRVTFLQSKREIVQFTYTAWPDHGVPNTTAEMLKFRNTINEEVQEDQVSPGTCHAHTH